MDKVLLDKLLRKIELFLYDNMTYAYIDYIHEYNDIPDNLKNDLKKITRDYILESEYSSYILSLGISVKLECVRYDYDENKIYYDYNYPLVIRISIEKTSFLKDTFGMIIYLKQFENMKLKE